MGVGVEFICRTLSGARFLARFCLPLSLLSVSVLIHLPPSLCFVFVLVLQSFARSSPTASFRMPRDG